MLAAMYNELNAAYDRRTEAYNRARRAFLESQTAGRQYQGALRVAGTWLPSHPGFESAPCCLSSGKKHLVYIQDESDVWHNDEECDEMCNSGFEIRTRRFCPVCAQQNLIVQDDDEPHHSNEYGDGHTWVDYT